MTLDSVCTNQSDLQAGPTFMSENLNAVWLTDAGEVATVFSGLTIDPAIFK